MTKIISLNVEKEKHLVRVTKFLTENKADIVCFQELSTAYIPTLEEMGYQVSFAYMSNFIDAGRTINWGVGLATKIPHYADVHYYFTPPKHKTEAELNDHRFNTAHPVIYAICGEINLAVTHFTWNQKAEIADKKQTEDLHALLQYLNTKPPHILCGDMNIPRQENILYHKFTEKYQDNIPEHYKSSIDRNLHRAKDDPTLQKLFERFMVDYMFSQSPYIVTNVKLHFGVSDHAVVVANIN